MCHSFKMKARTYPIKKKSKKSSMSSRFVVRMIRHWLAVSFFCCARRSSITASLCAENLDNIGTMTLAANPNAPTPLPGYSINDETRSSLVLHRLDRPQIGHDRIEVAGCDLSVPIECHWSPQLRAIRSDTLRDRGLDLIISPFAKAVVRVGSDIATNARRDLANAPELTASSKGERHVQWLTILPRRRVACHAMPECHQIGA